MRFRGRGQVMALGALTLLVLALMLMLSFNLSQTLHEKIRVQQHSDAMAYSMATIEARAMNYFAFTNRTMAASYVTMTSLHAYMASMSVTAEMMATAQENFYQIAGMEFVLCLPCPLGVGCEHCADGGQALEIASKFAKESRKYGDSVKDLEKEFNEAVEAFDLQVDSLHESQREVMDFTVSVLEGGRLEKVERVNAPQARGVSSAQGVGELNVQQFACALDNTSLPCSGRPSLDRAARSKVMAEVVNATRPGWPAKRTGTTFPVHLNPSFLKDLMTGIQGEGITIAWKHQGTAKVVSNASRGELESTGQGSEGITIGACEHGSLMSQWRHGLGNNDYGAEVYSNASGGRHLPANAHEGKHDRFETIQTNDTCTTNGNCFMHFRADKSAANDFGQPSVFAYITQDARLNKQGKKGPWELNQSGSVTIEHGEQGEGTLTLAPKLQARGLSKAKVYYHRLGDWREHPNLFNPYWRAKLHPFKQGEAEQVLMKAGDVEGAQLSAVAPVEGTEP